MKNRFYGDVNDYIKYGILDILTKDYEALGINWYLTDDQHGNQNHGGNISYLNKVTEWRIYNPRIFPLLQQRVNKKQRNINFCKTDSVINFSAEHAGQLPDNALRHEYERFRCDWHKDAIRALSRCDLVFFDPDIGIKSELTKNPVKASEYCKLDEITDYHWCDWLIVQFLRPLRRYEQLKNNPIVTNAATNGKKVMVFIYGGMALLYISKAVQAKLMCRVFEEWDTKVETKILVP